MSGTIDQIGDDVSRIKSMGAEQIIFGYAFSPIAKDAKRMMDVTKQLARFANNEIRLLERRTTIHSMLGIYPVDYFLRPYYDAHLA